jgi:hypothetical protein
VSEGKEPDHENDTFTGSCSPEHIFYPQ